jgi:hypothetical protein
LRARGSATDQKERNVAAGGFFDRDRDLTEERAQQQDRPGEEHHGVGEDQSRGGVEQPPLRQQPEQRDEVGRLRHHLQNDEQRQGGDDDAVADSGERVSRGGGQCQAERGRADCDGRGLPDGGAECGVGEGGSIGVERRVEEE